MRARLTLFFALLIIAAPALAQGLPSITEKTAGMDKRDGFFPVYWDAAEGKVWLEIPRLGEDVLYVESLPAGLGSNDIGLDRAQLGGEQVVRFERVGPKVLMVTPNLRYRAEGAPAAERRAVEDAFADGVVWGFTAAAATGGRVLVDATDFVVRDAHGVVQRLKNTNQGTFSLDKSRSTPLPDRIQAFPENTEIEARLTFTGDSPGRYVRDVAADPTAFSLRLRHSLVKLPEPGFEPRVFQPGSGYFGTSYRDYAVPIGEEVERRFITRHRLECAGPPAADGLCEPVEPIVYYLDSGTPEPVRSALLEGARWWNQAFEAAGFRDGYRVEMLPEDADPMDVRYNVINWVHRATRGWSYGSSVVDPRTGEIIKGHVTLGSLRVRQDYLLAEGLLAPYSGPNAPGYDPAADPMLAMALARIRQLSAHEVGHTIGLAHNFAASPTGRASVMDYPAPLATVAADGTIDLSAAYDTDIGEWDKVAVRYGYAPVPPGTDEGAFLAGILEEARQQGLAYLTDADARPAGAAHPDANLWDNGADMVSALRDEMAVRRIALDNFGLATIREGRPVALLEEVLVPLYLRHRYQVEGTVKLLGGVYYSYAIRGGAEPLPEAVPAEAQRAALEALLAATSPEALALPERVRTLIPPRPPGYGPHRELFDGYTGLTFDPYAPAEVAAALVFDLVVHPERAARLAYQEDFDGDLPGLTEVLTRVTDRVWGSDVPRDPYAAELHRIVQIAWVDALLDAASRTDAAPAVAARVTHKLRDLHGWLRDNPGTRRDEETLAHRAYVFDQLDRYLFRLYRAEQRRDDLTLPPGSPIGQDAPAFLQRHHRRRALLQQWAAWTEACGS